MNDKRSEGEEELLETLYTEIDEHYLRANKLRLEATKHSVKAALLLEKRRVPDQRRMEQVDEQVHAQLIKPQFNSVIRPNRNPRLEY